MHDNPLPHTSLLQRSLRCPYTQTPNVSGKGGGPKVQVPALAPEQHWATIRSAGMERLGMGGGYGLMSRRSPQALCEGGTAPPWAHRRVQASQRAAGPGLRAHSKEGAELGYKAEGTGLSAPGGWSFVTFESG